MARSLYDHDDDSPATWNQLREAIALRLEKLKALEELAAKPPGK